MNLCACGKGAQRDGQCGGCRLRSYSNAPTYSWREEWDEMLRRGYRAARRKADISRTLGEVERITRYPRHIVDQRVRKLGLSFLTMRPWTRDEETLLRELAGTMGMRRLAKRLHRSELAIKNKLHAMQVTNEIWNSYSLNQLHELLGVPFGRVELWLRRGWIRLNADRRVHSDEVARFIWEHLEEIPFRRADEAWLKGMLNPSFGLRVSADRLRQPEPMGKEAIA